MTRNHNDWDLEWTEHGWDYPDPEPSEKTPKTKYRPLTKEELDEWYAETRKRKQTGKQRRTYGR